MNIIYIKGSVVDANNTTDPFYSPLFLQELIIRCQSTDLLISKQINSCSFYNDN